jgi:hypothetical protein
VPGPDVGQRGPDALLRGDLDLDALGDGRRVGRASPVEADHGVPLGQALARGVADQTAVARDGDDPGVARAAD